MIPVALLHAGAPTSCRCNKPLRECSRQLLELVGRYLVFLHVNSIAVAPGAGPGQIHRVYLRLHVGGRKNVMAPMTAGTLGDLEVAAGISGAMHARAILLKLIDRK